MIIKVNLITLGYGIFRLEALSLSVIPYQHDNKYRRDLRRGVGGALGKKGFI